MEERIKPRDKSEAKDYIEQAIKDFMEISGHTGGVLMDWVVLTAEMHIHDSGDIMNGHLQIVPENQPRYRTVGLLDISLEKAREGVLRNQRD